jgi:Arc/MetJ-type ribon-helix-helix transcriptional regulator
LIFALNARKIGEASEQRIAQQVRRRKDMNLALKPDDQRFIEDQMKTGRFTSAEEVVGAALEQLRLENFGNFDTGELDGLIADGEADIQSGDVLSVTQVRENLGQRSAEFRRTRADLSD